LTKIMEIVPLAPFKEIVDEVKEYGGDPLKFCYQCGICDTVCPWNRVTTFSMRKLIRETTFGLSETEEMWLCTTCGRCPQKCPRDVRQIEVMVALRRMATGYNLFPHSVKNEEPGGIGQKVCPSTPSQRRRKFYISPAVILAMTQG
jgi:heterodisulfide reductase subunit C